MASRTKTRRDAIAETVENITISIRLNLASGEGVVLSPDAPHLRIGDVVALRKTLSLLPTITLARARQLQTLFDNLNRLGFRLWALSLTRDVALQESIYKALQAGRGQGELIEPEISTLEAKKVPLLAGFYLFQRQVFFIEEGPRRSRNDLQLEALAREQPNRLAVFFHQLYSYNSQFLEERKEEKISPPVERPSASLSLGSRKRKITGVTQIEELERAARLAAEASRVFGGEGVPELEEIPVQTPLSTSLARIQLQRQIQRR